MKKQFVTPTFYYVNSIDQVGGTMRTEVFQKDDGFHAYSHYLQDKYEEIVGFGKSASEYMAMRLSRKDLRQEWRNESHMLFISNESPNQQ